MSTIHTITIEGFRSIAELRGLQLRSLNVLIGANGSGKSNFLGALKLLRTAILGLNRMANDVLLAGGADRLLHFGSKRTPTMRFRVEFADGLADFGVDMRYGSDDQLFPSISISETALPPDFKERLTPQPGVSPHFEFLRCRIEHWRLYHFHDTGPTSPMKKTADLHDNRQLRADGSNLASLLYLLRKKHVGAYAQIRNTVRLAAPFLDDFALAPLELNEDKIRLEWRHVGSDGYFDASSLSDGSLRFIALATLLLQPASVRPRVVLLDEPELGLHPFAITLLASMLKHAAVESQIIVATQSPVLLDHFDPEDVLVADRVNGATQLNRLDGDKLHVWLEDFSLGELWEKNEFGGRPVPERTDRQSSE